MFRAIFADCLEKCKAKGQEKLESFLFSFIEEHLTKGKSTIKERAIMEALTISKGTFLQKVVDMCQKSSALTINVLKLSC